MLSFFGKRRQKNDQRIYCSSYNFVGEKELFRRYSDSLFLQRIPSNRLRRLLALLLFGQIRSFTRPLKNEESGGGGGGFGTASTRFLISETLIATFFFSSLVFTSSSYARARGRTILLQYWPVGKRDLSCGICKKGGGGRFFLLSK